MSKKVTLIVPDDTKSLIVAYQIVEGFDLTMGQSTIGTESIKNEFTLDIEKEWIKGKKEHKNEE